MREPDHFQDLRDAARDAEHDWMPDDLPSRADLADDAAADHANTDETMSRWQALAELAQTLLHLSRALDEAHNLATSAVDDRDFAVAERDVLREQLAELRAERDERAARVEKLAAELESWGGSMASALAKALRAALAGEGEK